MHQFLEIHHLNHADLDMYQCGTEVCRPGHYYGPAVRDHFLIHYIHSGRGRFCIGERVYHLQKGQCFLICPDIITYYQADDDDPWHYSWVGFHGLKAESCLQQAGLSLDQPIFTCSDEDYISNCFSQMIEARTLHKGREIRLLGYLYLFLSQLIEQRGMDRPSDRTDTRKEVYVQKAVAYIGMNYSRKMSISELSRHIGLDRSYLGSLFKEYLGVSPQDYLIHFRMNKACELIKSDNLTIGDISRSVGYDDQLLFSKLFKKHLGVPPREYRKNSGSS
jgi:AraC-like DNA-binding protein